LDLSPGISYFLGQLGKAFLAPGSQISLASLFTALFIAFLVLAVRRYGKGRRLRLRPLVRALFPRRIVLSRSSLADLGDFYFNLFVFGLVLGWAVLSYDVGESRRGRSVGGGVWSGPTDAATPLRRQNSHHRHNHYLSHRIPFLWEFHKVHHSATVLTPLTNFRVHPVYMCIFSNILAVFTGLANGFGDYLLGQSAPQYGLSETNIILVFFIYFYVHLQHTQLWISFTGWLGHLFMSPAHHQIHHSRNPPHFNKNLGSCLAVWDWIFGTLYISSRHSEKLEFGVEPDREHAHTIRGELITPFGRAAGLLKERFVRSAPPAPLAAADRKQAY
jgi:sterol desaturase/sphingolipid hydroxylase (fatty acid hydroxylase superfamily)